MDKQLFERLIQSAEQMVAIEKGELKGSSQAVTTHRISSHLIKPQRGFTS